MGYCIFIVYDSFYYGRVISILLKNTLSVDVVKNRITYSMGDIYLRPMMDVLKSNRGRVSTIFGILPAVTYCAGDAVLSKYESLI